MKKLFLFSVIILANCSADKRLDYAATSKATAELTSFIAEFSPSYGRRRRAPDDDMSKSSFEAALAKTKEQLVALRAIDSAKLLGDDLIDWKFAHSILAGRELEQEKIQAWKKDPRLFMAFTGISDVINRPGEALEKMPDIEARLRLVPVQLNHGMQLLDQFVPRFQELSVFMAENGFALFDNEIPDFIKRVGPTAEKIKQPAKEARLALTIFLDYLKTELPKKQPGDFAIGQDTYNEMLRTQYLLGYDADSLYRYGWKRFSITLAELEALAKKIDPSKTWQQLAQEIKQEYPDPASMIAAHQLWVDKAAEHIKSHQLIPIPWKEHVNVVPRAAYLRKTSYYGNFSIAQGLDKDSTYTSEWMINPFEDQWAEQRKQEYLTEHDWGVIIVTAPHETYAGHHVQGLYQMHNPRPLRKANGISIFSEGWGLYNEQLMQETGFFPDERIHLRQLQLRLWRNARVIYDVGMHTGKLTYEEAVQLMTDQVGFLRWAAQLEIDSSTASPGYFIGYFMGMMEILDMREAYKAKKGKEYSVSDFHETLLKIGNMPPTLMREVLLNH
jgi:uncharacterized protein (DUF885 family)